MAIKSGYTAEDLARLGPDELTRRRRMAEALALKAGSPREIKHPLQGFAQLADALIGGLQMKRLDEAEKIQLGQQEEGNKALLDYAFSGGSNPNSGAAADMPTTTGAAETRASTTQQPSNANPVFSEFMDEVRKGGVTNPNALAAIAATGQAESEFSAQNVNRRWSDPSQSGKYGTSGGLMSWRNDRLGNLEKFAAMAGEDAGGISPRTQAKFLLQEDPLLIEALNRTESVEDAMRFMNRAWKFAGYDQPSKEVARRMGFANSFLPKFQGGGEATAGGSADGESPAFLSYANQNATRNRPLSNELASSLGFLPEMGITAEVFSGGQPGKDEGGARTGSTRHDHGNAADVFFSKNGRRLDWANPEDLPIFEEIVRRGKAAGITGFGAGEGYMQPGSMHIGFGDPAVWGAGGSGENAPEWLVNAYNSSGGNAVAEGAPQTSLDAVNAMATGGRPEEGPRIAMLANALLSGGEQSGNPIESQRNSMFANALIGQGGNQIPSQGGEMPVDASGLPPEFQRSAQLQTAMQRPEGSIIQALMGGTPADPAELAQARAAGMGAQGVNGGMPAGGDKRQLIENLMRNPATQEIGQRLLLQEMEQRAQANDPMRALEMEKMRQDVQRGQPMINLGDGRLFDPNTREFLNAPGSGTMEAPEVKEFFDESGMPYKAAWNPRSGQWEKVGNSKAPSGTRLEVDPATGAVTFTQGAGVKPLTEQQSKDTVYSVRAEGSLPLIDRMGDALTSFPEAVGGQVPGIGNYLKSPEYQQAEQAGREFLAAILRKDTGAAITPPEMEEYGSVYLPRPGDSAEVLAQKQQSRARALAALKAGMPPQAILAQQKALAAGGGADPLAGAREAIKKGADRNAVIQRLKENGIDPEGL